MKEMLIPYKGDLSNVLPPKVNQEQIEADEKKRRAVCVSSLMTVIQREEKKWQGLKKLLDSDVDLKNADFKTEAIYYLEECNYDFNLAVKQYRGDLESELTLARDKKK